MRTNKVVGAVKTTGRRTRKTPARGKAASGASPDAGLVEAYIAGISESSRGTFDALRTAVRQAAPKDAVEVRSYGILALRTDRVLVWYAAFAKHCSLFPGASVLAEFKDELKDYKVSKGTVQFRLDEPVPVALVKKLVRARAAEAVKKK